MSETPFFFSNEKQNLFAVIHTPDGEIKNPAWVFCHPFGEEKLWAHRVYVNLARDLCSHGYPVMRFDYRGYGDSEGRFEDSTLAEQQSDIHAAIGLVLEKHPQIKSAGLLGLRYGATLASMVADNDRSISHLVLLDPVIDMNAYLQELLRANLTTQMVMYGKVVSNRGELTENLINGEMVNIDGYNLTREFFEPASKVNLLSDEKTFGGRCLIVQIGRANQPMKKDNEKLSTMYDAVELEQVVEEQFWKEIKNYVQRSDTLTDSILSWLGEKSDV